MHLTITKIFKSLFSGGYVKGDPPKSLDDEDHTYIKGGQINRGPCPGLNALANQGWLFVVNHLSGRECDEY